jgi:hypothetical protein
MNNAEKGSGKNVNVCVRRVGPGGFRLKGLLGSVLASPDFEETLKGLDIPPERIISPLLCFLYETDEVIRWRAVRGVGITVSAMAEKALESARVIMRRFLWSLNDESGGIAWGAPEAMGETMAENETLAREYHRILVSYIDEDGNPLDNDDLERGAMWAIGRLAQKRPELLLERTRPILRQLNSPDPVKRGLALRTLLFMVAQPSWSGIETERLEPLIAPLLEDQTAIRIFQDGAFVEHKIGRLAAQLLSMLKDLPLD